ncbi:hypothetical protein D3C85_1340390 [compost metagenome]
MRSRSRVSVETPPTTPVRCGSRRAAKVRATSGPGRATQRKATRHGALIEPTWCPPAAMVSMTAPLATMARLEPTRTSTM